MVAKAGRAADIAYASIRAGLRSGQWPSGTHLREQEIAEQLGMSRTPVRDALRRLAADGFLHFEPHLGTRVPGWTRRDLEEIFLLRLNLEGMAAELAALHASDEQIDQLGALADMMMVASQGDDPQLSKVAEANADFHRLLVEASGNRRLRRLIELVTEFPLAVRTFANYDRRALARSLAHHIELVEALRARDSGWAKAVMESHLRAGHEVIVKAIAPQVADGSLYTTT